jgi:probable HAF family extracellular repeat protein
MQDLGTLGGPDSSAATINASGAVFGGSNTMPNQLYQSFFWTQSTGMQLLGSGPGSSVFGVNASGQVVGTFGGNYNQAFLWTSTQHTQDLNNLIPPNSGWVLIACRGINQSGQIVANGQINGENHGALLTPTN